MKIGLVSDVHGNWEALKVVLEELSSIDGLEEIFFAGDIIGYGPKPARCVKAISEDHVTGIKGNHGAGLVGELDRGFFNSAGKEALRWTEKEISTQQRGLISELPTKRYLEDRNISLVHGSCANPLTQYIVKEVDAFRSYRACREEFSLQVFGHTHIPVIYELSQEDGNVEKYEMQAGGEFILDREKIYLVNPGSVGQPRDGNWRSSFAVLELDESNEMIPVKVDFYRKEYPAEKTRQQIIDAGLPRQLGNRLLEGR